MRLHPSGFEMIVSTTCHHYDNEHHYVNKGLHPTQQSLGISPRRSKDSRGGNMRGGDTVWSPRYRWRGQGGRWHAWESWHECARVHVLAHANVHTSPSPPLVLVLMLVLALLLSRV
eukprot:3236175-Pyramimonas_sp.AAC.1